MLKNADGLIFILITPGRTEVFNFYRSGRHRDLHFYPTRRWGSLSSSTITAAGEGLEFNINGGGEGMDEDN